MFQPTFENSFTNIVFNFVDYLPGSKERKALEAALKEVSSNTEDVPIIIGGQEFRTKDVRYQVMVCSLNLNLKHCLLS